MLVLSQGTCNASLLEREALMKTAARSGLFVLSLVALGACRRDRDRKHGHERPSTTLERDSKNAEDKPANATPTGASWVANDTAIDRIAASRCAREVTCSDISPDKHLATGGSCLRETRKELSARLKTSECPAGIDGDELDACLDAIRKESCSNPIEMVGRLSACRKRALCSKVEMPHR